MLYGFKPQIRRQFGCGLWGRWKKKRLEKKGRERGMECKVPKATTIDQALRRSWSCQHLIAIFTRPWNHHHHKTTKINLLTHTKNQNRPTRESKSTLKHKHLGARRIFANLQQGIATKWGESLEEDGIGVPNATRRMRLGAVWKLVKIDKKLAPTYFWNRSDNVDEWDIVYPSSSI